MKYNTIFKILSRLDAEKAHNLSLKLLSVAHNLRLLDHIKPNLPHKPVTVMGLTFPNPIGTAAGLDKNGDYIDVLTALGFGFLEVGTVTPYPQVGNPKPRVFRLTEHNAIINRMGFPNKGVAHLLNNLLFMRKTDCVVGVNIGKGRDTPLQDASADYITCLDSVFDWTHYVTINISSPNTKGLRELQFANNLNHLLEKINRRRWYWHSLNGKFLPLVLKVSPDKEDCNVRTIVDAVVEHQINGIIATNTTTQRFQVENHKLAKEQGGLSGEPLKERSNYILKALAEESKGKIPLIGVGGIMCAEDAKTKFALGARLVQVYTGLVYKGPGLVKELIEAM